MESASRFSGVGSKGSGDINLDTMDMNDDGGRLMSEAEEVSSNIGSPAVSGANDKFWEQFLSGSPAATDHELDLGIPDNEADGVDSGEDAGDEIGGEPDGQIGGRDLWKSKGSVDQLADQMGQLAPGRTRGW